MDTQRYICEKCGDNHPTEAHDGMVMIKLTNPDYLPSRQEVMDVLNSDVYDEDENARKEAFFKHREMIKMGHEVLNKEFIEELSNYLTTRIAQYQKDDQPITILEVGAGNGRMGRFLKERLNTLSPDKFQYIATNLKDKKYDRKAAFQVEEIDYKEALKKFSPTIVIASWMPYRKDWTADFRRTPSVKEYILIGERESTGHDSLTWGDEHLPDSYEEDEDLSAPSGPAPYVADGFESEYLEDVSEQQIKSPLYVSQIHPGTYSFRRVSK
jgi:hypothetical protein